MAHVPGGFEAGTEETGEPIGEIVGSIGVDTAEVGELGFDDIPFRVPADDSAVVRRTKAVAATRPLHDLERNKGQWEGNFWDRYDLVSMGIAVIDQVAMAMTVSAGMSLDDAHEFLSEQASRHSPDASKEERDAVAGKVLVGLVTDKPHEYVYVDHEVGAPVRHTYAFDLLYEQWNADETIHLRATPQAVNVLVSALDFDSDSAEAADEIQIRLAIESGAFESAVTTAEHARFRSINDIERIRQIVRNTQLDPTTHDWACKYPPYYGRLSPTLNDGAKSRTRSSTPSKSGEARLRIPIRGAAQIGWWPSCGTAHVDILNWPITSSPALEVPSRPR